MLCLEGVGFEYSVSRSRREGCKILKGEDAMTVQAATAIVGMSAEDLLLTGKQLPANMYWFRKRLEAMGIVFGDSNGDARFVSCALPEGWKVRKVNPPRDKFERLYGKQLLGAATRYAVFDDQNSMRAFLLVYSAKAEMWIP